MQISIVDRQDVLTAETREFAERRLLFVLSRFDSKIDRVLLVVDDVRGPQGRTDKKCSVTVKLKRMPEVPVSSENPDVEAGIAYVADRAGRTVQRMVERSQACDDGRLRPVWS